MGTSTPFSGAGGGTPLVPDWLDDGADGDGGDGGLPTAPQDGAPPAPPQDGTPPPAPAAHPTPRIGDPGRFRTARTNFTKFAASGGSDRRSLGRSISDYVSRSSGGAARAAQRMGTSRASAAGLVSFMREAAANGVQAALRSLNLQNLAGRPIEEVFTGLADLICPEGGSIDEGIARDAFIETIADMAEAGITDIDALTAAQIQTVFELYVSHAIEARLCNDVGAKVVSMPADPKAAASVEAQLQDFIQRGVSDAVSAANVDIASLTGPAVRGFVDEVYRSAFEILQTLGEQEAEQ